VSVKLSQYFSVDSERNRGSQLAGVCLWDSPEALAELGESELRMTIAATYQVVGASRIEVIEVLMSLREG
jgi:hypothetical protein